MKLFEATFRDGYNFKERYYDTDLKRSVTGDIRLSHEWYEESSRGLYTSILDDTIKLEKKNGISKNGRGQYGFMDPMYRNIRDNYWNQDKYNLKPRIMYLDIETRVGQSSKGFPVPENAAEEITMFQIYDNQEDVMIILALKDWKHQHRYDFPFPVKYIRCKDEIELITSYLRLFKKLDPLIVYAYNGAGFDFPYIYNRLKNLGMCTNLMSNHGSVSYKESEFQGRTEFTIKADGHFYIDLMVVYKNFTFHPMSSYSLDTVAEFELNEKKVPHTEYASFDDFYTGDNYVMRDEPYDEVIREEIRQHHLNGEHELAKEKTFSEFVSYGIQDTFLIKQLDDKQNFTILMSMISEKMGVQFGDSMGTVKPWSQYLSNKSMLENKVMPPRQEFDSPHVVGGYVRDPNKGKHHWVLSADVNSMYPLLGMVGFNMSPETYIPKHKLPTDLRDLVLSKFNDQDETARLELDDATWHAVTSSLKKNAISLAINGAAFSQKELGMIPDLVQNIYKTRKQAKNTMLSYDKRKVLIQSILKGRK